MSRLDTATAYAPASIGNIAVGFDMLGLALAGAGDRVTATRTDGDRITIKEVRGIDSEIHPYLSTVPEENTASIAAQSFWNSHGDEGGVELIVYKGVPLQSGMGSSAASAVAGAVAVNALLDRPLDVEHLLPFALDGETYASGGLHTDNVAPSLLGGMIFCPTVMLPEVFPIRTPTGISSVLVHPEMQIDTAQARNRLSRTYDLDLWLEQQGYLGGFLLACERDDHTLIAASLRDVTIEPQRAESVPCFYAVKDAALNGGALGSSLSGSGPSIFALCADNDAPRIAIMMEQASRAAGYECQSWISSLDAPGAQVEAA